MRPTMVPQTYAPCAEAEGDCADVWVRPAQLAWNKLAIPGRAATVDDLRVPPGNRLEQLRGDRAG